MVVQRTGYWQIGNRDINNKNTTRDLQNVSVENKHLKIHFYRVTQKLVHFGKPKTSSTLQKTNDDPA